MKHFSIREAARILDVTEAQVRAYVRAGPLDRDAGPGEPVELSFRDLLLLRTTKGLRESGVPARRMRRIWSSLRQQLSPDVPLTSISVYSDGARVLACDGRARWQADSGQFVLAFDAAEVAERAGLALEPVIAEHAAGAEQVPEPLRPERAPGDRARHQRRHAGRPEGRRRDHDIGAAVPSAVEEPVTAEHWFELGCRLEDSSPLEARAAYQRALELDTDCGDAHLNLGRHHHEAGELGKAEAHYRDAVRCAPEDATAHYNLGVLLEDRGRRDEAVHAYRQAIARDADLADAHYNLGLLLETLGRRAEAMRHLMVARDLYRGSRSTS
jgi:tetratricopeptide (TPR) repeat protein